MIITIGDIVLLPFSKVNTKSARQIFSYVKVQFNDIKLLLEIPPANALLVYNCRTFTTRSCICVAVIFWTLNMLFYKQLLQAGLD